jgi:hypothetical protein
MEILRRFSRFASFAPQNDMPNALDHVSDIIPQIRNRSLRSGSGVGDGHELAGDEAVVASVKQRVKYLSEIQMARTRMPAVRVGHMKMEDAVTAGANAGLDGRLFDIHVEGIEQ